MIKRIFNGFIWLLIIAITFLAISIFVNMLLHYALVTVTLMLVVGLFIASYNIGKVYPIIKSK